MERVGEIKEKVFHPLLHSPNVCNNQSWIGLKLRVIAFSGSPLWVQGSKNLGHPLLFFQAINIELGFKWSSQDTNHYLYVMFVPEAGRLACHCATVPVPKGIQVLIWIMLKTIIRHLQTVFQWRLSVCLMLMLTIKEVLVSEGFLV